MQKGCQGRDCENSERSIQESPDEDTGFEILFEYVVKKDKPHKRWWKWWVDFQKTEIEII